MKSRKETLWSDFKLQGMYHKKFQQSGLSPNMNESLKEIVV